MANQTNTSSVGYVSFLNLFGILISIVLCVLFILLGGHTLKYIKAFAVKIKIIINKAQSKTLQIQDENFQGAEKAKLSQAYQNMEGIYKNEIRKARSLQFWMIVRDLIAKYDNLLYYPFRDKIFEKYDLLKPKTTFYTLLFICSCCIAWMITIFLTAILQNAYSNVTLIPVGTFIGFTIIISIISSILNLISANRFFKIYILNVKSAFKVDYGHQYLDLNQGMEDYQPENSMEQQELLKHQQNFQNFGAFNDDKIQNITANEINQRTFAMREETLMGSTRKLLKQDIHRSDKMNINPHSSMIEERKEEEDQEYNNGPYDQRKQKDVIKKDGRGKPLKDIVDLQVGIEGADAANTEEKYIFIENKHAVGDMDLLYNESQKGENKSNIFTFLILFLIFAAAAAACCYLNYTFQEKLAEAVFYMFIGSFFGDFLVFRPLILLFLASIKYCLAKRNGYTKIDYQNSNDVHTILDYALTDMFERRRKLREEYFQRKRCASANESHIMLAAETKGKGNESIIGQEQNTQNCIDREDTSLKQMNSYEEEKEDSAQETYEGGEGEDLNGPDIPTRDFRAGNNKSKTYYNNNKNENAKQSLENTQMQPLYTQRPLMPNLEQCIKQMQDDNLQIIMKKKQLHNDLVDYNLLLLRKIYDAYEDRADKVLKNFRSDKHGVLRKRYMVPILNPYYNSDKLLKDLQAHAKDVVEEDSVNLDAQTVCEDFDRQIMKAITVETSDYLVQKKIDRQMIDKFGNPLDEGKYKNDLTKACPQPEFGRVDQQIEENIEENDEEASKRNMLDMLRLKLANGEKLTAEELALLEKLENERLKELERLINEMLKNGYQNLSDEDKLKLIGFQKERAHILIDQLKRKKKLTKDDKVKLKELEDELKRLELEELRLRQKLYGLSDEELKRLQELEAERLEQINKRIDELNKKGFNKLTDQEKLELLKLQQEALNIELDQLRRKQPPLSEEDLRRMKEIEDELRRLELEELLLKEKLGLLTDAEKLRLNELRKLFADEEQRKQEEERQNKLAQDEEAFRQQQQAEMNELEELRRKLLAGEITDEELRRLRELENKYGLDPLADPSQNIDEINRSRISEQDNFSELPPVQVMNNLSKPLNSDSNPSDEQRLAKQKEQERLEQEQLEKDRLAQEQLERNQLAKEQEEERLKKLKEQNQSMNMKDQNSSSMNISSQQDGTKAADSAANQHEIDKAKNEEFLKMQQQNKPLDDDLAFGHDDLEFGLISPNGAQGEDSIYSHKTTTILDEEKVSFMHIEHLPNQDNGSDDSFSEQDMVYYNKDDLTNYSKGLGLNKVKARVPGQQYFSENDLQEVQENEISGDDSAKLPMGRTGRSFDQTDQRNGYGRGNLSHRDLEIENEDDLIDGKKKVDSWNMNYRGKKKKLKKKKIKDEYLKKMRSLKQIYGVDVKTLAGLTDGRLAQQASGKFKGDENPGQSLVSDNSFRSTQNTFMNKQQSQTPLDMFKQSVNDAQSNLFSFKGQNSRQNFNDTGRKGLKDSRNQGSSNIGSKKSNSKLNFAQQSYFNNRGSKAKERSTFPDEESKSLNGSSRAGSRQRKVIGKNDKFKAHKGNIGDKRRITTSDGIDSHTESDEAVDDKGAMFQRRNGPNDYLGKGSRTFGGKNSLDHSESEEGNNQESPNFDGNEFMFNKRGASQQMKKKRRNSQDSSGELQIEDLEAQEIIGKNGRIGQKKQGKNNATSSKREGRSKYAVRSQLSGQRTDSEEENNGGNVQFQKRNPRADYMESSDRDSMGRSGGSFNSRLKKKVNNMSNKKPPQISRKFNGNSRGRSYNNDINSKQNEKFQSILNNQSLEIGNNDGLLGHKKKGQNKSNFMGVPRSNTQLQNSDDSLNKQRNHLNANTDEEADYIVGPNSNHSSLKKRPFGAKINSHHDDDEEYLLERQRKIVQDLEEDNGDGNNRLAKKRKIRKAAHSLNPKDAQSRKYQEMQKERLRKKREEAEAALFAKDDDLEKGNSKIKIKKKKKDWVKKEINYWLDYDSPYAEYLVSRFREWSPNPSNMRAPSVNSQRKHYSNKYSEILNVYSQNDGSRHGSSKLQSRSNERNKITNNLGQAASINITQQRGRNNNFGKSQNEMSGLSVNAFEEL